MKDLDLIDNLFSVKDKVVLITGGGGVASVNARGFAKNGAKVILATRRLEQAEEMKQKLEKIGLTIDVCKMDISKKESIQGAVDRLIEKYGRIDVLIHTAANCYVENTIDFSEERLRCTLDVNLLGTIFVNQVVGKEMSKRGFGRIINYNSIDAYSVNANDAMAYAVSKSGVMQATRFFATELAKSGVTVNGIAPIWIETPMLKQRPASYLENAAKQVPMGKISVAEDYLGTAYFLAGEGSSFITGQTFLVDGGWSCYRVFEYNKE